jgi:hypothetical protein
LFAAPPLCSLFCFIASPLQEKQRAAFALAAHISSSIDVTALNSVYNPFRTSQFDASTFGSAWNPADALQYVNAISASLEHPNVVLELRIPQSTAIGAAWGAAISSFFAGNLTKEQTGNVTLDHRALSCHLFFYRNAAVSQLSARMNAILSPESQRLLAEQVYRASLGLPQRCTILSFPALARMLFVSNFRLLFSVQPLNSSIRRRLKDSHSRRLQSS